MKRELNLFWIALMYFTRIRVPGWVKHHSDMQNNAIRYFSLIGIIVGTASAGIYFLTHYLLPSSICIIISMITSILMTGALHEDGFADVCDGFGGGWTTVRILEIMKDSNVGAYGLIGMCLMLLLKFYTLLSVPSTQLIVLLIAGHAFSRWCAACIIATGNYVRDKEESKAKHLTKKLTCREIVMFTLFGWLPLLMLQSWFLVLSVLLPMLATLLLYRYFKKWIDGYTGDCLGATQQITEILFYISFISIWKFI